MPKTTEMDWPVFGAISAIVVVAGGVLYEVVTFVWSSDQPPPKGTPQLASYGTSIERSANELPGFHSDRPVGEREPSFPLIRLIDPDDIPSPDAQQKVPTPAAGGNQGQPPNVVKSPPTAQPARLSPVETKTASYSVSPDQPPLFQEPSRIERWSVLATANASYFNLGGHIDQAGIVDSLASSHLRDALKAHRNFGKLPPDIRTQVLTQNIDLVRLAPYRGLLGMDDRILEQEQAVRFVRLR